MEHDDEIIQISKVRILSNEPQVGEQPTDALYSSPFSSHLESVEAPTRKPQTIEPPIEPRRDAVSTGTFGNLIRKVNKNDTLEERVANARQRIRFNLKRVGPRKKASDECEAWRKFLF